MRCGNFEQLFSRYIDSDLPREESEALRFHLNGCYRCLTKLEDMQRTIQAVRGLTRITPKAEFDAVLQQKLHREITEHLYSPSWRSRWADAFDESYRFISQRTVQAAFAASLLLTLMIGGLDWINPEHKVDRLALHIPIPPSVELGIEASHLMAPLPIETEPASFMVPMLSYNAEPRLISETQLMMNSDTIPDPERKVVLPLPSGELAPTHTLSVISSTNISNSLSEDNRKSESVTISPFNQTGRMRPTTNAYVSGFGTTPVGQQQRSQRYILPTIPSKRITRASF